LEGCTGDIVRQGLVGPPQCCVSRTLRPIEPHPHPPPRRLRPTSRWRCGTSRGSWWTAPRPRPGPCLTIPPLPEEREGFGLWRPRRLFKKRSAEREEMGGSRRRGKGCWPEPPHLSREGGGWGALGPSKGPAPGRRPRPLPPAPTAAPSAGIATEPLTAALESHPTHRIDTNAAAAGGGGGQGPRGGGERNDRVCLEKGSTREGGGFYASQVFFSGFVWEGGERTEMES